MGMRVCGGNDTPCLSLTCTVVYYISSNNALEMLRRRKLLDSMQKLFVGFRRLAIYACSAFSSNARLPRVVSSSSRCSKQVPTARRRPVNGALLSGSSRANACEADACCKRNSEAATIEWNGQSSFASAVGLMSRSRLACCLVVRVRNRRMESHERPLIIRARAIITSGHLRVQVRVRSRTSAARADDDDDEMCISRSPTSAGRSR